MTATFVALAAVAATVSCGGSSAATTVSGARAGGATPPIGAPGATPPAGAPGAQSGGGPPDIAVLVRDALQPLVDDGTLTATQMNAVQTALSKTTPGAPSPSAAQSTQPDGAVQPQDMFTGALDGLVSNGTLTDAQAQAVSNALADAIRPPPTTGQ